MARKERTKLWILSGAPKIQDVEDVFEFDTIENYNNWLISKSEKVYTTTTSSYVRDNKQLRIGGTWEDLSRANYVIIENLYENTDSINRFKWGFVIGTNYINRKVSFLDWTVDLTVYLGINELRDHIIVYNGVINRMHRNQWNDKNKTFVNNSQLGLYEHVGPEGEHRFLNATPIVQTTSGTQPETVTFLVLVTLSSMQPTSGEGSLPVQNLQGGITGAPSQYNYYLIPFSLENYETLAMSAQINGTNILIPGGVKYTDLMLAIGSDPKLIDGTMSGITMYYTNNIGQAWYLDGKTVRFGEWNTIPDYGKDAIQDYTVDYNGDQYHIASVNYIKGEQTVFTPHTQFSLIEYVRNAIAGAYGIDYYFDNVLTYYKSINFSLADGKNNPTQYTLENFNRDYSDAQGHNEPIDMALWSMGSMGLSNRVLYGFFHYYKHVSDTNPYNEAPNAFIANFSFSNHFDQGLSLLANTYKQSVYLTQNTYAQSFKNAKLSVDNLGIQQQAQARNVGIGQQADQSALAYGQANAVSNQQEKQNTEWNTQQNSYNRDLNQKYGDPKITGGLGQVDFQMIGQTINTGVSGYGAGGVKGAAIGIGLAGAAAQEGMQWQLGNDLANMNVANQNMMLGQQASQDILARNQATDTYGLNVHQAAQTAQMQNTQGAERMITQNNYQNALANIKAGRDDLFLQPASVTYQGGNSYFEAMNNMFLPYIIMSAPEKESMRKFDYYFNKYGYLSNVVFNSPNELWNYTKTRVKFNFLQVKYIKINSHVLPHHYLRTIEAMLMKGVTFWHTNAIQDDSYYNYLQINEQTHYPISLSQDELSDHKAVIESDKPFYKYITAKSFKNVDGLHFLTEEDKQAGRVAMFLHEGETYLNEVVSYNGDIKKKGEADQ